MTDPISATPAGLSGQFAAGHHETAAAPEAPAVPATPARPATAPATVGSKDQMAGSTATALSVLTTVSTALRPWFWPVALVALFLEFSQPLTETVALVPHKVRSIVKFHAGGVGVELERKADADGSQRLVPILRGLTREARSQLATMSNEPEIPVVTSTGVNYRYSVPTPAEFAGLVQLQQQGLITTKDGTDLVHWWQLWADQMQNANRSGAATQIGTEFAPKPGKQRLVPKLIARSAYQLTSDGKAARDLLVATVAWQLSLSNP